MKVNTRKEKSNSISNLDKKKSPLVNNGGIPQHLPMVKTASKKKSIFNTNTSNMAKNNNSKRAAYKRRKSYMVNSMNSSKMKLQIFL